MSSQSLPGRRKRIFAGVIAVAGALSLTGCSDQVKFGWLPVPTKDITDRSGVVVDLWVNSWIAALIVGMITWGLIIWCIIAYRRRKGTTGYPRQIAYHLPLEIFYLTIPLFMVLVFFYFTERDLNTVQEPYANPDVTIDVKGKQWAWDFNYRAGNTIKEDVYNFTTQGHLDGTEAPYENLPTLYLPVNKKVKLELTSRDVIHSFWIPAFLQKKDMIPGKPNEIFFSPQQEGEFNGKCAELCGEYHSEMLFKVKVVSEAEFQTQMQKLKDQGNTGLLDDKYNRNPNQNKESGKAESSGETSRKEGSS